MMRTALRLSALPLLLLPLVPLHAPAQTAPGAVSEPVAKWRDLRFGMFIHYSHDSQIGSVISHIMAGASDDYLDWFVNELPNTFNPTRWDPDELATILFHYLFLDG